MSLGVKDRDLPKPRRVRRPGEPPHEQKRDGMNVKDFVRLVAGG